MQRDPIESDVMRSRASNWYRWRRTGKVVLDPVPSSEGSHSVAVVDHLTPTRETRTAEVAVFVAAGTTAAPGAISAIAGRLMSTDSDVVTCDHVALSPQRLAFHKPGLSPHLLASGPYFGPVLAVRSSMLGNDVGATDDHGTMLQLVQAADRVVHIDRVWFVTREGFGVHPSPRASEAALKSKHLVRASPAVNGFWLDIDLSPKSNRPTTVVIPTRDGGERLIRLVDSITESALTAQVIVVDNDSSDTKTLRILGDIASRDQVRVLSAPGAFNFSRVCNRALARVETDTVAFVNDDVQPLDSRWLSQLVANLDDSDIGAVGAQLRFPEGAIQHTGVVLGLGGAAGHAFRGCDPKHDGYLGLSGARREVSAVTGACLVARTSDLRTLGGFDEEYESDFQDVDLCLRLRDRLGLATVVDPRRPLIHLESATRRTTVAERRDAALLRRRWGGLVDDDPYYSRRLPIVNPGYSSAGDAT